MKITQKIARFPLTRIIVGCAAFYFGLLLIKLLTQPILHALGLTDDTARMVRFALNLIILFPGYCLLFKWYEKRKITEFSMKYLLKEGFWGIFMAGCAISTVIIVLYSLGYYKMLSVDLHQWNILYPLIVITFGVVLEELIFRGIIYRITEESLGTILALIISALLFGLIHLPNQNATITSGIAATIGGVWVSLLFSLTRRLWLPIFAHLGWNLAQFFYGCAISGSNDLQPYYLVQSKLQGPVLFTGGTFGIENSIITIGLTLILAVVFYLIIRRMNKIIKPFWRRSTSASGL